ncbi:MAG: ABC transporter permease subunit [Dehalococcoidia bacterium]|nr:ABC transporter permease subunit [Dehalococcoidia bacterium]
MTTAEFSVDPAATSRSRDPSSRRRGLGGYLLTPVLLAGVLLALYVWVDGQDLDSIERRRVNIDFITSAVTRHIELTVVSTALVLLIAIPTGMVLTRPFARPITAPAIALFNIGQAVPSVALIVILAKGWTIGFWPAIAALVAYSSLPVLRNTMVGLRQVDATIIESARGMGMSKLGTLRRIELPLAVPVMLAGVRIALVLNVGTAVLAVFINAGGLGEIITTGIVQNRPVITVVGGVLTAVLALFVDYIASLFEDVLRPRGL